MSERQGKEDMQGGIREMEMSTETEMKTLVDALIFAVSHTQLQGVPKWTKEQQQLLQALEAISAKYGR